MMINHNEFGVTEEDFVACDNDEERVRALLFQKMKYFITRHPEVSELAAHELLVLTGTSEYCWSYRMRQSSYQITLLLGLQCTETSGPV